MLPPPPPPFPFILDMPILCMPARTHVLGLDSNLSPYVFNIRHFAGPFNN